MTSEQSVPISDQTSRALQDLREFPWSVAAGAWLLCVIAATLVVAHDSRHIVAAAVLAVGGVAFTLLATLSLTRSWHRRYHRELDQHLADLVEYEREAVLHLELALRSTEEARLSDAECERLRARTAIDQAASASRRFATRQGKAR